jgi:hypothetical protein
MISRPIKSNAKRINRWGLGNGHHHWLSLNLSYRTRDDTSHNKIKMQKNSTRVVVVKGFSIRSTAQTYQGAQIGTTTHEVNSHHYGPNSQWKLQLIVSPVQ